jgi:ABC-2 type transport system permease protein
MTTMLRALTVLRRDVLAAVREYLLAYMLFAPFLLALVLRLFIPMASDVTIRLIADPSVTVNSVAHLEKYAVVERVRDAAAMERRVRGADDAIGVNLHDGQLRLIAEGNEPSNTMEIAGLVVAAGAKPESLTAGALAVAASDRGETQSPLRTFGTASILLLAAMMGGMLAGLSIIEEKEGRMLTVLAVTPLSKAEYFVGKSLVGILVPLVQAILLVPFMGALGTHMGQLLFAMLCLAITSLVLGFFIGAVSPSQIAGIANMKFLFLAVTASFLGAVMVPQAWRWTMYWSPFYWSARSLVAILERSADWAGIIGSGVVVVALSVLLFAALGTRIRRGLTPVGM